MTIRIATHEDISAVEKLRIIAYETATGSKIPDSSFLLWNENDEQSIVLVLENETKQIIATMRGNVFNTKIELEKFLDITSKTSLSFPVLTMGRAATLLKYRKLGYSAAMRILFFNACLNSKIQFIASTIQADASRVALFRQMGYHIEEADISHRINSYFQNTSKTLINILPKKGFSNALAVANDKIGTPFSAFEIQNGLIAEMKRKIDHLCLPHSKKLPVYK